MMLQPRSLRNALSLLVTTAALVMVPAAGPTSAQVLDDFVPVTDAMLQDPADEDWLMWRRTLDGWGYSPLDQIDRDNVGDLRLVWTRALNSGSQQGTPLAYRGVLYMPNPGDVIQAIDAATGDLIWEHRRDLPADLGEHMGGLATTKRTIAIYGRLLLDTTGDDFLMALDAVTGEMVWETEVLDYTVNPALQTAGPTWPAAGSSPAGAAAPTPPPTPAWSPPTTPAPERSCGGGAPFPAPASPATRRGATCRSSGGSTSAPGWSPATTPS